MRGRTGEAEPSEGDEQPALPGAPYIGHNHPRARRIGYLATGIAMGLLGTFGNSLVLNNLPSVAGEASLYTAEAAWLSAAYVGVGAASNLLMIKGRQQFGLTVMLFGSLTLYILAAAWNVVWPSFAAAIVARGLNGLATSTGAATGVYMLIQALPKEKRALSLLIVISTVQIASPLARLLPVETITMEGNRTLDLIVLAIPLFQMLILILNRLPPTYTIDTLGPLDLVTACLIAPAMVLLAGVLALGRSYWWSDTPWLGWMLAGAIALIAIAAAIELNRRRPLFAIAWLPTSGILLFTLIVLLERVATAEQSSAAPGLLGVAGLDNDQYRWLFGAVALSMAVGIGLNIVMFSNTALPFLILAAITAIGAGAVIDSGANGLTRPFEMIGSQCLIGLGTTMFVGPAILFYASKILKVGPDAFVTLIVIFAGIQNLGSVAGAALINSTQYIVQQTAATEFLSRIRVADGPAADGPAYAAATLADVAHEAAVVGYVNSFRLVVLIVFVALVVAAALLTATRLQARRKPEARA